MNENNGNATNNATFEGGFDCGQIVNSTTQQQPASTARCGSPMSFYKKHQTACNILIGAAFGFGLGAVTYRILGDKVGKREGQRIVQCGMSGAAAAAGIAGQMMNAQQPTYIDVAATPVQADQIDPNITDFTEA